MAVFYQYSNAVLGSQTTVNGNPVNYNLAPTVGATWQWSGTDTTFTVEENDGAIYFNGDATNEQVGTNEQPGGVWQQIIDVGGTDRSIIWDYTFELTGPDNTVYTVGVIDVDLNSDGDLQDAGEDGVYLIFPDGQPPPDTPMVVGPIVNNANFILHEDLGATVVCFTARTRIDTPVGPRRIETLKPGDLVLTRDHGAQPIRWIGGSTVPANNQLAPIVITAGTLGNTADFVVSPLHAVLVTGWQAELLFGAAEVLVRAKDLLNGDTVYRRPGGLVTYWHILLDAHQLLRSEGMYSESLYPGDVTLGAVPSEAQSEILALFPELQDRSAYGLSARPILKSFEVSCLAAVE